jgi:prepilin-type N-terminal cleavage/methylation domain-containing protein
MAIYTKKYCYGFTLIEVLLVIVLLSISLGISVPYLVGSLRGNRLRTATRTLVSVCRYTRSMAIIKNSELALNFNLKTGKISLSSKTASLPDFSRNIEGVSLEYVNKTGSDVMNNESSCSVKYNSHGICTPFEVKIVDVNSNYAIIKVDALSSIRNIEYGKE